MATETDLAATLLARAARRMQERRAELCAAIDVRIIATIGAPLDDEELRKVLRVSTEANVMAALHVLEFALDPAEMEPPVAAAQWARRLAQHGAPLTALLRAYRLGQADFIEAVLHEITADPDADPASVATATVFVVRSSSAYVDRVSESLVTDYEAEREAWARNDSTVRAARIRAVLGAEVAEVKAAERALGYPLGQTHLGVMVWFGEPDPVVGDELVRLERLAAAAAGAAGCQHLFTPRDENSAAIWYSSPAGPDPVRLVEALAGGPGPAPRVALGRPGGGIAGFRDTHRQAGQARQLALYAGAAAAPVTDFAEVGAVALLCRDLPAARDWVADTLGGLAADEENAARLRETARVFFATGCSHTAAADLLCMHKNSVQYRIQKAEQLRGRPFKADRFDVEFALRACHLLGAAVLKSA